MAAGIGGSEWTIWEAVVTFLSSSGVVTILGSMIWSVRKGGQNDEQLSKLRTDLDAHKLDDKELFTHVNDKIDIINAQLVDTAKRSDIDRLRSDLSGQIQTLTSHVISAFRRGDS
jgi:hypothetical protein